MKLRSSLIKMFSLAFAVCTAFAIATMPAKAEGETASFSMAQSASIRNEEDGILGLQFSSSVNASWLANNNAEKYTFGTLIYPASNEASFNSAKSVEDNITALDAVKIVHVNNAKITANTTFNASIVYDENVVKEFIANQGKTVTDELVEELLTKLYNKDFTARSYAIVDGSAIYTGAYTSSMYKTAVKTYELGVQEENDIYTALALNYFESVKAETAKVHVNDGILVFDSAVQPEFSSNAMVILNDKTLVNGVDYSVDLNGNIYIFNSYKHLSQVNMCYVIDNGEAHIVKVEFAASELVGIEAELKDTAFIYERTSDISQNIKFRFAYSDGSFGLWNDISSINVKSITVNGSVATATIAVTYYNVELSDTIEMATSESVLSVSQALNATVNNNYVINGVVVSFATNLSKNEWVLIDKTTGSYISVLGMGGGKLYENTFYSKGVEIGDEITVPVTIKKSTSNANKNKVYAEYIGGADQKDVVVSKNNKINVVDNNIVIDSQEDLNTFLSGANIPLNRYKVITLRGEMNFVMDETYADIYKFWFYDSNATGLSSIEIGGIKPSFSNASCYYTTGKSFTNLVFDNQHTSKKTFDDPLNTVKEIKAMFIGGGTYAQFVIFDESWIKDVTPTITSKELVAPNKRYYVLGEDFSLDGAKLIYNYDIKSSTVIDVTEDMIKNMPVIDMPGNYTITVNDGAQDFDFEITVLSSVVKKIEVLSTPNKTTYTHRDSIDTIDLTGAKILVTYENETTEELDITKDMLVADKCDEWKLGTVNYVFAHVEHEFSLSIVYEENALSIAQFKAGTADEIYDVKGVVVGPVNTQAYAEILLKDKTSGELISIINSGCAGTTSTANLDTTVLNVGDEIIVKAQLIQMSGTTTDKGNKYRIHGDAFNKDEFVKNLIILSTGNTISFDVTDATTISSDSELSTFLNKSNKTYKIVKLVGLNVRIDYSAGYWMYFTKKDYVDGGIPILDIKTSQKYVPTIKNYFTAVTEKVSNTEYEIYALYVGGSGTYRCFVVLSEDWLVKPSVN